MNINSDPPGLHSKRLILFCAKAAYIFIINYSIIFPIVFLKEEIMGNLSKSFLLSEGVGGW